MGVRNKTTMIRTLGNIPQEVTVACSGGPDSMAVLDFLSNSRPVGALFFNHGTETSHKSEGIVKDFCKKKRIPLSLGAILRPRDKKESLEEYWRNERFRFYAETNGTVITAHNLDDVVETWIFSSIHGNPSLIPFRNQNVIRPFLITQKKTLLSWCVRKGIPFYVDPSNYDVASFPRARIRNNILPEILKINPGVYKVVRKMLLSRDILGGNHAESSGYIIPDNR